MEINHIVKHLKGFILMPQEELLKRFSALPGAVELEYEPDNPIIFVPGTRKKGRVLLVAHYDTVFHHRNTWDNVKALQYGPVLFNPTKDGDAGLGADDRAGCALLWSLRKLGHSLLLLPDEEIGCKGSKKVVDSYPEILQDHAFMMQFDRRGARDLVYYRNYDEDLHKYLVRYFYNYNKAHGSNTDIAVLADASRVSGVNVSIGYVNEHTKNETQDVFDYMRTGWFAKILLSEKNIPNFRLPEKVVTPAFSGYRPSRYEDPSLWEDEWVETSPGSKRYVKRKVYVGDKGAGNTEEGKDPILYPNKNHQPLKAKPQQKSTPSKKETSSTATGNAKTSMKALPAGCAAKADAVKKKVTERVAGRNDHTPIFGEEMDLPWYCPTCQVYPDSDRTYQFNDEVIHKECGTNCIYI